MYLFVSYRDINIYENMEVMIKVGCLLKDENLQNLCNCIGYVILKFFISLKYNVYDVVIYDVVMDLRFNCLF